MNNRILNHAAELQPGIRASSYFADLLSPAAPNQVRLRYVPFNSYRFLQTPLLPVTPLRIGFSTPWSGRNLGNPGWEVHHAGQTKKRTLSSLTQRFLP